MNLRDWIIKASKIFISFLKIMEVVSPLSLPFLLLVLKCLEWALSWLIKIMYFFTWWFSYFNGRVVSRMMQVSFSKCFIVFA
jgi:hypothetical protein